MRAVVVYESWFGNTEPIAQAIASGLRGACEVSLLRAADATPDALLGADVLFDGIAAPHATVAAASAAWGAAIARRAALRWPAADVA